MFLKKSGNYRLRAQSPRLAVLFASFFILFFFNFKGGRGTALCFEVMLWEFTCKYISCYGNDFVNFTILQWFRKWHWFMFLCKSFIYSTEVSYQDDLSCLRDVGYVPCHNLLTLKMFIFNITLIKFLFISFFISHRPSSSTLDNGETWHFTSVKVCFQKRRREVNI